jgi:predicted DNA-binding ribbon-helix-helix protein
MQSEVLKRSIVLKGHKTSVSLENAFWFGLKEIAADKGMSLGALVAEIDSLRCGSNLSSALRLYVLERFKKAREKPEDDQNVSAS